MEKNLISKSMRSVKQYFMLIISNSFKGRLRIDPAEGIPYTAKKNGEHGIGLKNMRRVAKIYG